MRATGYLAKLIKQKSKTWQVRAPATREKSTDHEHRQRPRLKNMSTISKANLQRAATIASAGRKQLVRFTRPFEQGTLSGYVLDLGPQFFLLALVDETIRFNGFVCVRVQDVRRLKVPAPYAAFIKAALHVRGEKIPKRSRLGLASLKEVLVTAGRAFPVITVHREKIAPDVCHIGRVIACDEKNLSLLEIGPDADWDDAPTIYKLREITRVDFGGGYEDALSMIGGAPPAAV